MLEQDHREAYKYNMYSFNSRAGDSRWATDEEMKKSLRRIRIAEEAYPSGGVPLISNGKEAYVDDSDSHSLIIGATGSKKTRMLCMPLLNILAKAGESFITTDPKGELYERTSGILSKHGYNVVVLNFRAPSYGAQWNPLELPYKFYRSGEKDKAAELINDFVTGITLGSDSLQPFWERSAAQCCFGLLWLMMECAEAEQINVRSLSYLRSFIQLENQAGPLYELYKNLNPQTLAAISLSGTMNAADVTRASIGITLDQCIRVFSAQQNLSEMLSQSSFDLERIGQEKTAIFIIMPDEKSTYHFLVSLFVKQCYEALIHSAYNFPQHMLPVRVNFVLDEFANMPTIPDMSNMISAARSRNIRFSLVVQGEYQLVAKYKEDAQTIKGNCSNWIFLTSRELPLLREVSDMCGSINNVPLISVSQLQRLNKERGESLVFHARQYPFISLLADIDQYEFEKIASIAIPKRNRQYVRVFDLADYLSTHTTEQCKQLFKDEFTEINSCDQGAVALADREQAELLHNLDEQYELYKRNTVKP